jgi:hypothetical protein
MTTGNWNIGEYGQGTFYAQKTWSGADGKTEAWQGGTRAKWNNYNLTHVKMTQTAPSDGTRYVAPLTGFDLNGIKATVGWSNNDELRTLNKLAEAVRGHSFNLGVNLAEATKSYSTIVGNLRSVGSALLALKRGNVAGALRSLGSGRSPGARAGGVNLRQLNAKDLSGRWLETQYAFMPLIDQSYQAAKALEAVTGPRVLRFSVGSGAKRKTVNQTASPASYAADAHWQYSYRLTAELYEDISLRDSLQLVNPAEVAWEVVPYSFVVDWFIPVGSYLSAWGVIPKLVGRFLTIERGSGKRGKISKGTNPLNETWKIYAATNRKDMRFVMKRTVTSQLSVPHPSFNSLPRALSPKRLLNAVALIHQRLS